MGEPVERVRHVGRPEGGPGPAATARGLAAVAAHGVVPVVRFGSSDRARRAIALLRRAGFRTFEVTLTVPGAVELIAELARDPELLLGVGTVLDPADADRAIAAGARYVVSPVLLPGLAPRCREAGVPCLLSGLTPSEVHAAWSAGADAVKVFPASSMGGPDHLRALRSVLPQVPLVPTGGVSLALLPAYLDAGAAFVGVGGDLLADRDLDRCDPEDLVARARRFLDAYRAHRSLEAP